MIRSTRLVARTPFAFVLALAALSATPLAAQQTTRAHDSRLAARLDADTRLAVVAIVDSAQRRRVPVEPLVDKALEGASKRARGEMTVALGVLTELAARGAPADTVASALVTLADAGASDAALAEFGRDVQSDISGGIASPTAAVATRTQSFLITGDAGENVRGVPGPRRKP